VGHRGAEGLAGEVGRGDYILNWPNILMFSLRMLPGVTQ
jgi:hypothetical protein